MNSPNNHPKIWLSSPHMCGKELENVQEAFASNWVAPLGPHVDGFEKELSLYCGTAHTAALSSGTAALHLSLILNNVQAGDEVICSSFTFSASANPIVYQHANPIFIDSEEDTWNMSPEFLEEAIKDRIAKGKKPKCVILVHLYGMPAQCDKIGTICQSYGIPLIEDAAEALGSHINGKHCGSFGEMGILSFNGNKIITTSGGGALMSNNEEAINKARFLATQARDAAPHYQHSHIGYNYRMSNICAAIGRGQLSVINERIDARRKNYAYYVAQLSNLGIDFLSEPENYFSNRWLTCILVDPNKTNGKTREDIRLALEKFNIESRPLWKPMHMQPIFEKYAFYGNSYSNSLFEKGLCLPSGSNLSESDLAKVCQIIHQTIKA